jgi:hypothetical protein
MTIEEAFFKTIVGETERRIEKETAATTKIIWGVYGRLGDNHKHNASLKVTYGGLTVLVVNYPISGYTKEVDIVTEVNRAEGKLFADAIGVCGARGLMTMIHGACMGKTHLIREIPVMFEDGTTAFPFSEN